MSSLAGLTVENCDRAHSLARPSIDQTLRFMAKRFEGVMLVLDPQRPYGSPLPDDLATMGYYRSGLSAFERRLIEAKTKIPLLWHTGWGDPTTWEHPYLDFAIVKALASWKTGLSSRAIQQSAPYLYERGWTKWGGSIVGEGRLVIAFSGVEDYFDEMFCEWQYAGLRGVCMHEMHRPDGVMADPSGFIA